MERKTTLKELAKILNVSISTVSKGLNGSNEISEETKARIREVALLNNYVPNEFAQSLKGKKTKTIGVIVPDVLAHFFAKSLHGIETTASSLGYRVIICISNESNEKEAESVKILVNGNVEGIIVSLSKETQAKNNYDHFLQPLNYDIPIVLFDRVTDSLNCDRITINDAEAARLSTQELFETGCRNILYLSTIFDTSVGQQRQKGYIEAMEEQKITPLILNIKDRDDFASDLLKVLEKQVVDGILATDELAAVAAMKTALQNGYKIPDDISVIGFTNGILGEYYIPSLTTVEQYAEEQGSTAVKIVVGRMENTIPKNPINKVIKTAIIRRESTKGLLS